jgi:hypothetical protein
MSATVTLPRRNRHNKISLSAVYIPVDFNELSTQQDVSELVSPIATKSPLGLKDLKASEILVGPGIGIKAIAPFQINFKILVTHGEVLVRSY